MVNEHDGGICGRVEFVVVRHDVFLSGVWLIEIKWKRASPRCGGKTLYPILSLVVSYSVAKFTSFSNQRLPPEITKVSPVIQDESDEARKTAAPAMSWGCPMRPSGVCASTCLRISLSAMPAACVPSVPTMPGLMAFTRMPRGPSSLASERVIASTAPFVPL